jgi:hypothetical protein
MTFKKISAAAAIAAAMTVGGASTMSSSASAAQADAVLLEAPSSFPVHKGGSACTAAQAFGPGVLARTKWKTMIACHPYLTRKNKLAYHWVWIRIDPTNGDLYTSDGYVYPDGAGLPFPL